MRAVTASAYGGPEVLELTEQPDPKVWPDAVLVRVRAASINPVDYKIVRGYLDGALPTVLPFIPGWDVAGEVVAAGPAVDHVRVGQPVYGYARKDVVWEGTWADLVTVPARGVAAFPERLSFAEAACIPLAGLTAYQALAHLLEVGSGDTVLVHAASGGVGTMAVQVAAALGARVIGTASPPSAAHVEDLGATHVAYGEGLQERVREVAPDGVDAVLDLVGGEALECSPQLLRTPGRLVSVVDPTAVARLGGRYWFVRPDVADLTALAALVEQGRLAPVIQERFALEQVRSAVTAAEAGGVRGKLVLEL